MDEIKSNKQEAKWTRSILNQHTLTVTLVFLRDRYWALFRLACASMTWLESAHLSTFKCMLITWFVVCYAKNKPQAAHELAAAMAHVSDWLSNSCLCLSEKSLVCSLQGNPQRLTNF